MAKIEDHEAVLAKYDSQLLESVERLDSAAENLNTVIRELAQMGYAVRILTLDELTTSEHLGFTETVEARIAQHPGEFAIQLRRLLGKLPPPGEHL